MSTVDLKDWILEENLRPCLEILSMVVGYNFTDLDWDAIHAGIVDTNAEHSRWYEYPLGDGTSRVKVAKDLGTAVVMVTAAFPPDTVQRTKLAIQIAQSYRLVSRH